MLSIEKDIERVQSYSSRLAKSLGTMVVGLGQLLTALDLSLTCDPTACSVVRRMGAR